MANEFHQIEDSLKTFLVDQQTDKRTNVQALARKYNNLKVSVNPKKYNEPHIIIRIGISEVVYNIQDGKHIFGGLGADTKYVKRWIDKNIGKTKLQEMWAKATKVRKLELTDDESMKLDLTKKTKFKTSGDLDDIDE